ncbi:MAG: cytochrome c family protein [Hyphomonadaceae bacterium]|nr:MAG: cytochrome c [Caulobacteraceae bacterium]MBT9447019.1 cytochrome c family protein [Hyphomonadaceae bacterium]TPW08828.1 MAG: cytochrome c [Alphaproteobacteria bacterium]
MSGNLRNNMIAGATLASILGVLGLGVVGDGLFASHYPEKPGYAPEVAEGPSAGGGEAAAPKPIDWGLLLGDAAALPGLVAQGEKITAQCKSCHTFDSGGANGTGPNLYGVVGRGAGTHAGFAYSEPMVAHAAPWSYDELSNFLKAPNSYVRGTKMAFAGVKKESDRVALIAYLRSLAPSPAAIPAPLPAEAPAEDAAPAAEPQKS